MDTPTVPFAMRPLLIALGLLASSVLSYPALVRAQPQTLSLAYDAPTSCVPQTEFVRRLRDRLPASPVNVGAGPTLSVNIVQADGQYVGRLSLTATDGRRTTKTLSDAHDCDGLVDALALVAALAMRSHPRAGSGSEEGPETPAGSPRPLDAERVAPTAPGQPTAPGHERAQAPSGQSTIADERPAQEEQPARGPRRAATSGDTDAPPRSSRSRLGGDVGATLTSGFAPVAVLSGLLGLDWALDGAGVLSPAFGLAATAGAAPQVRRPGGSASFVWLGARVTGCALRLAFRGVMQIRGCLLGDVGWVLARGGDTFSPGSSSRAWLSLGASSQLEFPVAERFAVRSVVGIEAPIRHDRYAFGSDHFFQVPILMATASASFVAYFH